MLSEPAQPPVRKRLLPRLGAALLALQSGLVLFLLLYSLLRLPGYFAYAAQLRSAAIASQLANRVQPALLSDLRSEELLAEFTLLESVNSEARAFLLDAEGAVLLTPRPQQLARMRVTLTAAAPLLRAEVPRDTVYGDDPESLGEALISIAPVRLPSGPGYIYLTIRPFFLSYLHSADGVRRYLILVFPLVIVATLLSWWMLKLYAAYLLRQFAGLVDTARALGQGDRERRVPLVSSDEIGQLAAAFNATADAILLQEEEIARGERSRRFLVAGVLHDLRAPLAAVRGLIEVLGSRPGSLQDRERMLTTVNGCVQRQSRFIESLEQLTQVELAADSFTFGAVDLDQLVSAVIELLSQRAKECGVELQYTPCSVPPIAGDSFWISRAITNVVVNAIHYTPPRGRVSVELSESSGSIRCAVRDSGVGIPEEEIERIFEHFYRATPVVAEGKEGSGLGLAVVKKVVERHHGSVTVESELGKGTTFQLSLPCQPQIEPVAAMKPSDGTATQSSRPTAEAYSVALAKPECFLSLLALGNWLTAQLLSHTTWPGMLALAQLALLWLPIAFPQRKRLSAWLLPVQAAMMGAMFLALDPEILNAGRALLANNVMLGAILVIGFAPVSTRIKWGYALATLAIFIAAGSWFQRFELIAAGMASGATLGLLLIIAFRSRSGQEFRIRFGLSVATVMTFSMLTVGYETFTGMMLLSEIAAHAELTHELPAVQRLLTSALHSATPENSFLSEHLRLTQYNPAIAGLITSAAYAPKGVFGEQGRDVKHSQPPAVDVAALCATSMPVGLRLAIGSPLSLCADFSGVYLGEVATFIVSRASGRSDAIERKQLEIAVAEMLIYASLFIALGVRTLGFSLYRSFTAPLAGVLQSVTRARTERLAPHATSGMTAELLEVQSSFFEMVEKLRTKQEIVAEADRRLRELVGALLHAVEPFNQRIQLLLPECTSALRRNLNVPPALSEELLRTIDREIEVVDRLFLLTKLELAEVSFEQGLVTLEELLWGIGDGQFTGSDGTLRTLRLESSGANQYFTIDTRYTLKLLQLCVEEIHELLPPERGLVLAAHHGANRFTVELRPDPHEPDLALQHDYRSIRFALIKKLTEALQGSVELSCGSIRLWIPTDSSGSLR